MTRHRPPRLDLNALLVQLRSFLHAPCTDEGTQDLLDLLARWPEKTLPQLALDYLHDAVADSIVWLSHIEAQGYRLGDVHEEQRALLSKMPGIEQGLARLIEHTRQIRDERYEEAVELIQGGLAARGFYVAEAALEVSVSSPVEDSELLDDLMFEFRGWFPDADGRRHNIEIAYTITPPPLQEAAGMPVDILDFEVVYAFDVMREGERVSFSRVSRFTWDLDEEGLEYEDAAWD